MVAKISPDPKQRFRCAKGAFSTVAVVQDRVRPKATVLLEGLKFYELESQKLWT